MWLLHLHPRYIFSSGTFKRHDHDSVVRVVVVRRTCRIWRRAKHNRPRAIIYRGDDGGGPGAVIALFSPVLHSIQTISDTLVHSSNALLAKDLSCHSSRVPSMLNQTD
jgi:hypothetical protein